MTYEEEMLNIANNVLLLEDNSDKIIYLTQELETIEYASLVSPIMNMFISLSN